MLGPVSDAIEPIEFGDKYLLVEHIATGGMAEIYRAQYTGIEGFAKDLVVKRLREEYAKRPEVVEMFLNEAKVSASLTHNNIIHTYDLGEIDGEYFIAMELLRGEELVSVLRRGVASDSPISQALAIGVIQQTLEGLHYAHELVRDGEEVGIVHRDINPTNIYVGYDGVCKVVDFGIVLTRTTRRRSTNKFAGKMSYMAPEQMRGEVVDRRSDLFPVGVMLHEMTVGQRLFRGSPDQVRRRVLEGDIPAPTMVVPDFSPELEDIILKALEGDPDRRYQNADQMFRDLDAYLISSGQAWTSRQIRDYMSELFDEPSSSSSIDQDQYQDIVHDPFAPEDLEEALARFQASKTPWANLAPTPVATKPRRAMTLGSIAALVPEELPPEHQASFDAPGSDPLNGGLAFRPAVPQAPESFPPGFPKEVEPGVSGPLDSWTPPRSKGSVLLWSVLAVLIAVAGAMAYFL